MVSRRPTLRYQLWHSLLSRIVTSTDCSTLGVVETPWKNRTELQSIKVSRACHKTFKELATIIYGRYRCDFFHTIKEVRNVYSATANTPCEWLYFWSWERLKILNTLGESLEYNLPILESPQYSYNFEKSGIFLWFWIFWLYEWFWDYLLKLVLFLDFFGAFEI